MQNRFKFRVYFKGSDYADAGYVDLTRSDVIFMLRADGQIIRNVVYECQQEGHDGSPCNMPFAPNNDLYDIQFCTGLKDKNGKLIYEGDILQSEEYPFKSEEGYNYAAEVLWDDASATFYYYTFRISNNVVGRSTGNTGKLNEYENWKVIGNIYENPELLED